MTDLTEQFEKRTLRNGAYYIKTLGGDILPAFCNTEYILKQFQTMKGIYDDVTEVLAEVPSYEEWQKLLSDQLAKIEGEEINAELEAEIKEKETQRIELMMKLNDVNNENHALGIEITKLKELLKECHSFIEDYDNKKLLTKIDEVLK